MNNFFKKAIDKSLDINCLDKTVIVIPNRKSTIHLQATLYCTKLKSSMVRYKGNDIGQQITVLRMRF